jgi:serine/threonine protein kinase
MAAALEEAHQKLVVHRDFKPGNVKIKPDGTVKVPARAAAHQHCGCVMVPIRMVPFDQIRSWAPFDADRGIDSAREIREYFVPDFFYWKDHDSYQRAFDRLLRDLKAEAGDGATA